MDKCCLSCGCISAFAWVINGCAELHVGKKDLKKMNWVWRKTVKTKRWENQLSYKKDFSQKKIFQIHACMYAEPNMYVLKSKQSSVFISGQDLTCKHALLGKPPSSGRACLTLFYTTRCTRVKDLLWL